MPLKSSATRSPKVAAFKLKAQCFIMTLLIALLFFSASHCQAEKDNKVELIHGTTLDKQGTQWFPYVEWAIENSAFSGNPFDIEAWVRFIHPASGEKRKTQMFYAGNSTWKFRFTGTRTGIWNFVTESDDQDLNGKSGKVYVNPNPDLMARGFLVNHDTKFAQQNGPKGDLHAVLLNIYMNGNWDDFSRGGYEDLDPLLDEVLAHGCNGIFLFVANSWFQYGTHSYKEHESENPDPKTFEKLENLIKHAFKRGVHVHIWAWGDEERKWTPMGVGAINVLPDRRPFGRIQKYLNAWLGDGGINGVPDKRLQRYIAARLGPLPGWSMGYGFDLEEWVTEDQVGEWAGYLQKHMGWPHLLMARGRTHPNLHVRSISHYGGNSEQLPRNYVDVVKDMEFDRTRPHLYEERFLHTRWDHFSMDVTRRHMWWYAMAGGMGGFWGTLWNEGPPYPDPQQMRTHKIFWNGRFLLDMERDKSLTDIYALKTPDSLNMIFYKEDTDFLELDLSSIPHPLPGVAVDTKKEYREIDLGILHPKSQSIFLPYQSDWALALGRFYKR